MKIKFKPIIILAFLITLLNCESDPLVLKKDTRVLVKGNIEDANGASISNAEILVYAKKGNGYPTAIEEDKNMLGSGFSDAQGNFSVTSALAIDDEFTVEIKATDDYSLYVFQTDTEEYVPHSLIYSIPTVTLHQIATINYNITKTSIDDNSLQCWFRYVGNYCFEVYNSDGLDGNRSDCPSSKFLSRNLTVNNPDTDGNFTTQLGSIIEFTYSLNGEPNVSEFITINDLTHEFTFTY